MSDEMHLCLACIRAIPLSNSRTVPSEQRHINGIPCPNDTCDACDAQPERVYVFPLFEVIAALVHRERQRAR